MSLLVRHLPADCTSDSLEEYFSAFGTVLNVRISGNVAHVLFGSSEEVSVALSMGPPPWQGVVLTAGSEIDMEQGTGSRGKEETRLMVREVDGAVTLEELEEHFSACGVVKGVQWEKVERRNDSSGLSAIVEYETSDEAKTALVTLQGSLVANRKISLQPFNFSSVIEKRTVSEREFSSDTRMQSKGHQAKKAKVVDTSVKSVFVKGLPFTITREEIEEVFSAAGSVLNVRIPLNSNNAPRGIAYVDFDSHEAAATAVNLLGGTAIGGKLVFVELSNSIISSSVSNPERLEGCKTVMVRYFYSYDEELLKNLFTSCGKILRAQIQKHKETGQPLGYAFVEFEDQSGADAAISVSNTQVDGYYIQVAYSTKGKVKKVKPEIVETVPTKAVLIRNYTTQNRDALAKALKKFGDVRRIVLGADSNSEKVKDFVFVDFRHVSGAEAAVKNGNNIIVDGCKIAIQFDYKRKENKQ